MRKSVNGTKIETNEYYTIGTREQWPNANLLSAKKSDEMENKHIIKQMTRHII